MRLPLSLESSKNLGYHAVQRRVSTCSSAAFRLLWWPEKDQEDTNDMNDHVTLMVHKYSNTVQGLIWLGEIDPVIEIVHA